MYSHRFLIPLACLGILPLQADEDDSPEKASVPRPDGVADPVTLDHFREILSNSPFRRLMSFSDDLSLTGVAKLPGGTVVTVYDRRARETYTVAAKENAQGWRLVDVSGGRELDDVQATIHVGRQEVTLRFDERRLSPEAIRRSRPRRVKPATRPEEPSVEQWLAELDPNLLKNYDQLDEKYQDRFRYAFEDYLETYPTASSELRMITARENLEAAQSQQDDERDQETSTLQTLEVGQP